VTPTQEARTRGAGLLASLGCQPLACTLVTLGYPALPNLTGGTPMPLPIIADTALVRLVWTNDSAPRAAVNDLHIGYPTGSETPEAQILTNLNALVTAGMWTPVTANGRVGRVEITRLDGTSASVVTAIAPAAKWTGGGTSDCVLQGAAVVGFKSTHRGPAGRNRIYLPWIGEGSQVNGTLVGDSATIPPTAWETFRVAMLGAANSTPLKVVSAHDGVARNCVGIGWNPILRTQRRRARR
jgi:hypothetical protein